MMISNNNNNQISIKRRKNIKTKDIFHNNFLKNFLILMKIFQIIIMIKIEINKIKKEEINLIQKCSCKIIKVNIIRH